MLATRVGSTCCSFTGCQSVATARDDRMASSTVFSGSPVGARGTGARARGTLTPAGAKRVKGRPQRSQVGHAASMAERRARRRLTSLARQAKERGTRCCVQVAALVGPGGWCNICDRRRRCHWMSSSATTVARSSLIEQAAMTAKDVMKSTGCQFLSGAVDKSRVQTFGLETGVFALPDNRAFWAPVQDRGCRGRKPMETDGPNRPRGGRHTGVRGGGGRHMGVRGRGGPHMGVRFFAMFRAAGVNPRMAASRGRAAPGLGEAG